MAKIVRLTEEDLVRLVNRVVNEQANPRVESLLNFLRKFKFTPQEIQQAQTALKAPQPQKEVKPATPPNMNLIGM